MMAARPGRSRAFAVGARTDASQKISGALVGNLWTDPKGRLWLFFDQQLGDPDKRITNWWMRCDNPDSAEPEWTDPVNFAEGCTLNKPTILANATGSCRSRIGTKNGAGLCLDRRRGVVEGAGESEVSRLGIRRTHDGRAEDGRIWMLARTKDQPTRVSRATAAAPGASRSRPRRSRTSTRAFSCVG